MANVATFCRWQQEYRWCFKQAETMKRSNQLQPSPILLNPQANNIQKLHQMCIQGSISQCIQHLLLLLNSQGIQHRLQEACLHTSMKTKYDYQTSRKSRNMQQF